MKKTRNIIGLLLMYLGMAIMKEKYILIGIILMAAILTSCASAKYGCPPSRIEKLKFNK